MNKLFDRRCVLLVGEYDQLRDVTGEFPDQFVLKLPTALRIEGLRVTFKLSKDLQPTPNTAEMTIYNLSETSRSHLQGKGQRVVLLAGYEGDESQIFSGDVRRVVTMRQGPDIVTKIDAGDGERAIAFARVSESYAPGTPIKDVVIGTIKKIASDPAGAIQKAAQVVGEFASGYAQFGKASTELTRLLAPQGLSWSIQDGRIEILGDGEAVAESAPLLSPSTGLVGSPSVGTPEKKGGPSVMKCRSLLLPRLRPGQRVALESESLRGVFRSIKVTHAGDTAGNDWYTDIEATPS